MRKNYIKPSSEVYAVEVSNLIAESPGSGTLSIEIGGNSSEIGSGTITGDARDASTSIWDQEW